MLEYYITNNENIILFNVSVLLLDNFGENQHSITRFAKKNAGMTPSRKYCQELLRFAFSLHFRSVSA